MFDAEHQSLTSPSAPCLVGVGARIDAQRQKGLLAMLSAAQLRAARALLNWHQTQVADAAQVSVGTVRNFETERGTPNRATLKAIQQALEEAGVEFLDHEGVRLRPRS